MSNPCAPGREATAARPPQRVWLAPGAGSPRADGRQQVALSALLHQGIRWWLPTTQREPPGDARREARRGQRPQVGAGSGKRASSTPRPRGRARARESRVHRLSRPAPLRRGTSCRSRSRPGRSTRVPPAPRACGAPGPGRFAGPGSRGRGPPRSDPASAACCAKSAACMKNLANLRLGRFPFLLKRINDANSDKTSLQIALAAKASGWGEESTSGRVRPAHESRSTGRK